MGFPILQEIWDGVRWVIDFFFNKTPKVIQIIIVLLFIAIIGGLIAISLQLFGFHCDTSSRIMKIDSTNLPANVDMLWTDKTDDPLPKNITVCQADSSNCYNPQDQNNLMAGTCSLFIRNIEGNNYDACNVSNPAIDCFYAYRSFSALCNFTNIFVRGDINGYNNREVVCLEDAYWGNVTDGWFQKTCNFPEHYYFSKTTGVYECLDWDYCGTNATSKPKTIIDEKLKKYNAKGYYAGIDNKNIDSLVYLTCTKEYTPQVTVYGFPIFEYRIWILLILITVLVSFLIKLKQTH